MGNMDQLPDFATRQSRLGKHAEAVKIHDPRDHDLHKAAAAAPNLRHQSRVVLHTLIAFADKAAVIPLPADGKRRCPQLDAVFRRDPRRCQPHAPLVAAGAQEGTARLLAGSQVFPDGVRIRGRGIPGDCPAEVRAVQHKMHMAVRFHGLMSPFRKEADAGRESLRQIDHCCASTSRIKVCICSKVSTVAI